MGQGGVGEIDGYVLYTGHGDGFTGVYICKIYHLFKI